MQTMSGNETYNGWTNYATWGVALVLDNDRGTYEYVRERAETYKAEADDDPNVVDGIWTVEQSAHFALSDFLKSYVEDMTHEALDEDAGNNYLMASQLMGAALSDVNWDEIAENILSES